jgi:hypothetical protein
MCLIKEPKVTLFQLEVVLKLCGYNINLNLGCGALENRKGFKKLSEPLRIENTNIGLITIF